MKKTLFTLMAIGLTASYAQLNIQSGATFVIQSGATVTVQGDVVSQSNIQGAGKLQFKGTSLQNLNMNGNTIDVVMEIDNTQNVTLTGATRLNNQLLFTNGKLQLGNFDFTMSPTATTSGANTARFVVTNGSGVMKKEMNANGAFQFVVGNTTYHPVTATVSGASFSNAFVSARAVGAEHPQKHPRSSDFLEHYWAVNRSGITGGTTSLTGVYDNTDVTGTEPPLRSFTWNGAQWALGTGQDNAANSVAANMSGSNLDLYGMNRFVLVSPKALLQGAWDNGAMLMKKTYRTPTVILPLNDPYRSVPYSGQFTHTANSIPEVINASVLNAQGNPGNNIVDWLFVELRNASNSTTAPIVQTRSVLVQRDGDIVDIDGVSPVYFKDVDAANSYVITVRHRNHLGLSTNPASPLALGLSAAAFDFSTAGASSLYGTANTNYFQNGGKNFLYAGDATRNGTSNYVGIGTTDRAAILATGLNGTPTPSRSLTTVADYLTFGGFDLNFDKTINYVGIGTLDRGFLLSNVLGGVPNPSPARSQLLPSN